jgi:hypothetical protein
MQELKKNKKLLRKRASYREKYHGKSVEFLNEREGQTVRLKGRFVVHLKPPEEIVDIDYLGPLGPSDPANSYYWLHLDQKLVECIKPANQPDSEADFLLETPLTSRHRISHPVGRPPQS